MSDVENVSVSEKEMVEVRESKLTVTTGNRDDERTDTTSEMEVPEPPTDPVLKDQLKTLLFGSKLNIFYACVPIAFLTSWSNGPGGLIFASSFFALIPLAAVLGDLTEDLALRTNDAIGALINVTFGNATEVIVALAALRLHMYDLIKMTMIGSVMGNTLLVLGSSLVVGAFSKDEVKFNANATKHYIGLLILASFAILIPSASNIDDPLRVSQHVALFMVLFYALYLYFQLKTHKHMFDEGEAEDEETPQFSFCVAFISIGIVALLISFISDLLVGTVSAAAATFNLSQHFIGLVIIPIVGNVAEHASAILMARKGKMDIAFGVALGSAIQIEMFAYPAVVVISWMLGYSLDLNITKFLIAVVVGVVILTQSCVADGVATWLSGGKMLCAYVLLAVAFLDAP